MTTTMNGDWLAELQDLEGQYIWLETMEGVRREGQLSKIAVREVEFNDRKVALPAGLELNGDHFDTVPFQLIRRFGAVDGD